MKWDPDKHDYRIETERDKELAGNMARRIKDAYEKFEQERAKAKTPEAQVSKLHLLRNRLAKIVEGVPSHEIWWSNTQEMLDQKIAIIMATGINKKNCILEAVFGTDNGKRMQEPRAALFTTYEEFLATDWVAKFMKAERFIGFYWEGRFIKAWYTDEPTVTVGWCLNRLGLEKVPTLVEIQEMLGKMKP